jgi:hypothetical protein
VTEAESPGLEPSTFYVYLVNKSKQTHNHSVSSGQTHDSPPSTPSPSSDTALHLPLAEPTSPSLKRKNSWVDEGFKSMMSGSANLVEKILSTMPSDIHRGIRAGVDKAPTHLVRNAGRAQGLFTLGFLAKDTTQVLCT